MARESKNWTVSEQKRVAEYYFALRKEGMKKVRARISAQSACIPADECYTELSMQRFQILPAYRSLFDGVEEQLEFNEVASKAIELGKAAQEKEAKNTPAVQEKPIEDEEPTSMDYIVLAMRAMRTEIETDMNAKLSTLLDLLTAPEGGKQAVEEALLVMIEPKKRLPKLVIIGLLNAQLHVVNAKLGHKFRVVNFTSEQTGSAAMVASMKGADLVVTFADMVGHHVDNLAMKHARHWFPHHGGLTKLVEKILTVKI